MIPAQIRALRGWLVWRAEMHVGDVKPRKVPYYVHGGRRSGRQGSDEDRRQWATFADASAFVDRDLTGDWQLGFAMSPEWGLVGLDFDACVDAEGRIDENVLSVISDTYSEFSPSGTGVHAFLSGSLPDRKSKADAARAAAPWGFEVFCRTGFLTMTGRTTPVCELQGWDTLDHVNGAVSDLVAARFGSSSDAISTLPRAPAGLDLVALRSLLWRVTPDGSYSEWLRRGMALHHETSGSAEGLELWDEHSQLGDTYPGFDAIASKWGSFGRDGADGVASVTVAYLQGAAAPDVDVFADLSVQDDRPPLADDGGFERSHGRGREQGVGHAPDDQPTAPAPSVRQRMQVKRRGIPEAHHLTTDQANANRLVDAFGRQVLVAAGRWHVWDGRRWLADEADVYRYGCRLSGIIREEASGVEAKAALTGDAAEVTKAQGIAKSLRGWALKSEMKGTIEAAIGLARKMLTVDEDQLDRDPALLNCLNGTVDLRTGQLRGHNPDDYITRLAGCAYEPGASCEVWERSLLTIARESSDSGPSGAGLASFLQRWAGYCLTGLTVEQVFAVLWGSGSNGKSTVVELWAEAAGDYAATAAPGLMMASKGERHPTEIASLMGRRMVTAHESGEGVVLREDFIKQATGGDKMTARFMRADFFEFSPTHKLQLLTNHKPAVKGQDRGIWRRVLLVPFLASFGDAQAVAAGKATALADVDLVARLRGELEGVLAWMVRGAVAWFDGGLRPPPAVREASDAYKTEQDRVGQFVAECCERGGEFSEPLTDGMGGLYPAYTSWCRDGGTLPLSKSRFTDDVLRVVGVGATREARSSVENGRRKLRLVPGLRLLPE